MKVSSGCLVLFLLTGFAFIMFFSHSISTTTNSSSESDVAFTGQDDSLIMKPKSSRKLIKANEGYVNVEDYHPIDPVPSSKASIRRGPIQHGSPLIPYIPKVPSPPNNPGQEAYP